MDKSEKFRNYIARGEFYSPEKSRAKHPCARSKSERSDSFYAWKYDEKTGKNIGRWYSVNELDGKIL